MVVELHINVQHEWIHMHRQMYSFTCTHMWTHMDSNPHMYGPVYTYVWTHMHMHTYIYFNLHIHIWMRMHTHKDHTHTHTDTHIYVCMFTHTHAATHAHAPPYGPTDMHLPTQGTQIPIHEAADTCELRQHAYGLQPCRCIDARRLPTKRLGRVYRSSARDGVGKCDNSGEPGQGQRHFLPKYCNKGSLGKHWFFSVPTTGSHVALQLFISVERAAKEDRI